MSLQVLIIVCDIEEKSVLLATGSADPYAYLYNIGEVGAMDLLRYVCVFRCTNSLMFIRILLN